MCVGSILKTFFECDMAKRNHAMFDNLEKFLYFSIVGK